MSHELTFTIIFIQFFCGTIGRHFNVDEQWWLYCFKY